MSEHTQTFHVGAATVSVINVGDIQGPMGTWMDEPTGGWPAAHAARLKQAERFPTQCVHIGLPGLSVLVDVGVYQWSPQSPLAIPHYQPPPNLLDQLRALGVERERIQHVVITHFAGSLSTH